MTTDSLDMSIGTPLGDAVAKLVVAAAYDQPTVFTAGEAGALFDCVDRLRPLADMLNGAADRLAEPVREDLRGDVTARLVNAVRVEELERAAAAIEAQLEPSRFGSWRDPGCAESAYRDAHRIVRDMARVARDIR